MSVQTQSPPPPSAAVAESDLDSTAELPVLDAAAFEAITEARTGNTDTWIVPAPAEAVAPGFDATLNLTTTLSAIVGEDKGTQLEVSLHAFSDELREVEGHLKRKGERLAEIEQALTRAQAERAAAEQRTQQLTAELAQARAAALAAEAKAGDLQRTLEEREVANLSWRAREKELEEKIAFRDKAMSLVQRDLTAAQAVATTYLESLRSLEGRRGLFQELSTSLFWEVEARESRLSQVQVQLAAAASRTKDVEAALAGRDARISELEAGSRTAQSRCEELEAANAVQRKRVEQLEAELVAVRAELQQRVAALQEASTERNEHMGRIAAGEAQVAELERRILEQQEFVRVLQAESNASVARVKELEGDLRAAEDMIHRVETELRGRNTRVDELERTNQQWRATVEEARNALSDRDSLIRRLEEETANSAVLLGAIQQRLDSTGTHEIAPDGDKRLLIRSEGDSEIVHVLSRKTSVGRTPDNDLQIDAKYISRHHAVILAGPVHTIIEDLNSTNGVLVNGRRITRQTLKDGDSVMIGKTMFRFAVRPVAERRA